MRQLALALATGALALTSPAFASENDLDSISYEAANPERTYSYDGVEYQYTRDDVTLRGEIAGGTNTLETHAARAEAAKQAAQGLRDLEDRFGIESIAPNKYRWDADGASGAVKVVVSLDRQMAFAYKGDTLVGAASISTARDGMVTPTGIFPIWLKKELHHSRKYDNAPMPHMQMIDKYGIALHAGYNPGYPDSHGCIRLPKEFAKKLFALTDIGTVVHIGA